MGASGFSTPRDKEIAILLKPVSAFETLSLYTSFSNHFQALLLNWFSAVRIFRSTCFIAQAEFPSIPSRINSKYSLRTLFNGMKRKR